MKHQRLGNQAKLPATLAEPRTKLHIFVVGKEFGTEDRPGNRGVFQRLDPVQGRSRRNAPGLRYLLELVDSLSMTDLPEETVLDPDSCTIHHVLLTKIDGLRGANGLFAHGGQQTLEPPGRKNHIVVHPRDEWSLHLGHRFVDSPGEPDI